MQDKTKLVKNQSDEIAKTAEELSGNESLKACNQKQDKSLSKCWKIIK